MNKKVILSTFGILLAITVYLIFMYITPESKIRREIQEENKSNGPFVIEEEFLGPNLNNTMYIDNINPDEVKI